MEEVEMSTAGQLFYLPTYLLPRHLILSHVYLSNLYKYGFEFSTGFVLVSFTSFNIIFSWS